MTYEPRSVKRQRPTLAELDELDNAIVDAVRAERPVTLRGVFYRVVSAGAVAKTEAKYKAVGRRLTKLRRSGRVRYEDITDGTRMFFAPRQYSSVDQMLLDASVSYRRMLWRDQPVDVQIYSEKDAITGAIFPVTDELAVPLGIVRGYCSETFAYRVAASIDPRKETYVYQLGDHDPSGVDAWRDFVSKVRGFAPDADVEFERLAVTPEQIRDMHLPTRPTKGTDTRSNAFDGESVEVDAIPAHTLRDIVRAAIEQHIDPHALAMTKVAEQNERDLLRGWAGLN